MCAHREHRTGNCRECRTATVALSTGNAVTLNDYLAGDYGLTRPVDMPQLWDGDDS